MKPARFPADALLPQTLTGVFDEAFDLYKRHFSTLTLLTALITLPTQLVLTAIFQTTLRPVILEFDLQQNPDIGGILALLAGVAILGVPQAGMPGLISLVALALVSGPLSVAVSRLLLGESVTIRQAYAAARGHYLRLLGGWGIAGLAFLGAFCLGFLGIAMLLGLLVDSVGPRLPEMALAAIELTLLALPYLLGCALIAQFFAFTTQILTLENSAFSDFPERNRQLAGKTRFRRTFAAICLLPVLIIGLHSLAAFSLSGILEAVNLQPFLRQQIATLLSAAISLFFQPYAMIFLTRLYLDYRIQREGLDILLMAQQAAAAQPESLTPSRESGAESLAKPPVEPSSGRAARNAVGAGAE